MPGHTGIFVSGRMALSVIVDHSHRFVMSPFLVLESTILYGKS